MIIDIESGDHPKRYLFRAEEDSHSLRVHYWMER